MHIPRLVISGLSGGSGKTMLSLGLARAFARRGLRVRALKKGPDYIDSAWLALAARAPQANIDPFFTPGLALARQFAISAQGCDLALIEGNRGLFDGLDIQGSCSTAEVSRLTGAPVLLVVDCTKMTRTTAAVVKGCLDFEPGLRICGAVLNRTGNARHAALARQAVEELAGLPVLGALPRRRAPFILERHMGLAGAEEYPQGAAAESLLEELADYIEAHLDLERVLALAATAPPLRLPPDAEHSPAAAASRLPGQDAEHDDAPCSAPGRAGPSARRAGGQSAVPPVRIGYVHDAALWFYYQENLDALVRAGAELTPLSLLCADPWPKVDGLYLGGGLPELHAADISRNRGLLEHLAGLCLAGLPVYAECGGFMVLAENLRYKKHTYRMAGVFPFDVEFCERPQGLGYIEAESLINTPFYPAGCRFRGHEFHFSRLVPCPGADGQDRSDNSTQNGCAKKYRQADGAGGSGSGSGETGAPARDNGETGPTRDNGETTPMAPPQAALRLQRGKGMGLGPDGLSRDGLVCGNTFAAYAHIYAPAVPHWADTFVALCRQNG